MASWRKQDSSGENAAISTPARVGNAWQRLGTPQDPGKILTGVAGRALSYGFGWALGDDLASGFAAFRPQINDPIGRLDHVQIVLDDQQRVARGAKLEQDFKQFGDVMEVQAGGRLIENVEGASGSLAAQLGGQLDPLRRSPL